jgi:translation initiation factor 2 alpha subunit (eIF-2alpha)
VKVIKEAFSRVKVATQNSVGLKFYVVAAPKYCIQVTAENFKEAEKTLNNVAGQIITNVKSLGGEGSFRREK